MMNCDVRFNMEMFGNDLPTISLRNKAVVFMKGENSDQAYVVKKGAVQVRRAGRSLETAGPGCMIGEVELLDPQPRAASAVAVEETELIVIDRELFNRLSVDHPDFSMKVMTLLAQRLRELGNAEAA